MFDDTSVECARDDIALAIAIGSDDLDDPDLPLACLEVWHAVGVEIDREVYLATWLRYLLSAR